MQPSNDKIKWETVEDYLTKLIYRLEQREVWLKKLSNTYSNYRLAVFLSGLILTLLIFFSHLEFWALIIAVIFIVTLGIIAHFHAKLDNGRRKLKIWKEIKSTHLSRLNLNWEKIPKIVYFSEDLSKPNESDLNITGSESLHQLINTATSKQGREMLMDWLSNFNPSIDKIYKRQSLVKELIPLTRLRDKLILNAGLATKKEFDEIHVSRFLTKQIEDSKLRKIIFIILIVLAPVNIILFILFLESLLPGYWGITTLMYIALYFFGNREKETIADESEYLNDELGKLSNVFKLLERYPWKLNSGLYNLCKPFLSVDEKPSYLITKIKNVADMVRIKKGNPFVWYAAAVAFPVDFYFDIKFKKYKNLISNQFNEWLNVWYNLEALCSLANFAYLNPDYVFPEISERKSENEVQLEGKGLGHPLIKKNKKIKNDFSFIPNRTIALITGSNMSGKSTFLRTLGINLSLAYAGSVLDADSLKVSLFRLVSCIKVSDSVIDGISYFYAEVKRLKTLLDECKKEDDLPVFFLIDEIFRGTNNIERLKGSYAFIKALAKTNSLGAIATHDLELVNFAGEIPKIRNYHFKEEIKDSRMTFNYKINSGPCPTTNALKIMQLEGLPVE